LDDISIWKALVVFAAILLSVLPWVLALSSIKVRGTEKAIWFLSSFCASWLGYFVFYILVVRNKQLASSSGNRLYRDKNGVTRDENGVVIK
jgi:hypothetical protein